MFKRFMGYGVLYYTKFYNYMFMVFYMSEKILKLIERGKRYKDVLRDHVGEYRNDFSGTLGLDSCAVGRNIRDGHSKRMAGVMGLSGITMPLKAAVETCGGSVNRFIYDSSPELFQKVFDMVYYSVPESMNFLVDFSADSGGIDDVTSMASRFISLASAYVLADSVIFGRDLVLKKFKLRDEGKIKEVGKLGVDFGTALTLGSGWEYVKYGVAQVMTKSLDAATRTNATMAVALPTSALHMFRGWFLDVGTDLVGCGEGERTPKFLKNKSLKFKKKVFNSLLMASVLGTAGVYYFNGVPLSYGDDSSKLEDVGDSFELNIRENLFSCEDVGIGMDLERMLNDFNR